MVAGLFRLRPHILPVAIDAIRSIGAPMGAAVGIAMRTIRRSAKRKAPPQPVAVALISPEGMSCQAKVTAVD